MIRPAGLLIVLALAVAACAETATAAMNAAERSGTGEAFAALANG